MIEVVNLVVCYKNEREVLKYANSVSKQRKSNSILLVITMNSQEEMERSLFEKKMNEIKIESKIYYPNKNLGYLNGMLYGYKQYCIENMNQPRWVIMSNTDIQFKQQDFFDQLLDNDYSNDIWCIAPSVYSLDKQSYDNPHYTDRLTLADINKRIFIFEHNNIAKIYFYLSILKSKMIRNRKSESRYIYSAHGCFFIISYLFAGELIKNTYKAFMYSEESYIAEKLFQLKKKCYYDSSIEVIHEESTVTKKLDRKKKNQYFADSLKQIRDEFY